MMCFPVFSRHTESSSPDLPLACAISAMGGGALGSRSLCHRTADTNAAPHDFRSPVLYSTLKGRDCWFIKTTIFLSRNSLISCNGTQLHIRSRAQKAPPPPTACLSDTCPHRPLLSISLPISQSYDRQLLFPHTRMETRSTRRIISFLRSSSRNTEHHLRIHH